MIGLRGRRRVRVAAFAAAAALALAGCGGSSGAGDEGAKAPDAKALDNAKGVTTVTFWHAMKGTNGETLAKLVDKFNSAHQGKIKVQPVFQGNYDDTIAKYKAAVQQKGTPSLVQIYDIGTRFMIDSKQAVPMADFIKSDNYDVSNIEPNIANYYSVDGKLWSMPFNTSMPLLYINADAFKKAGLDPNKPPKTLAEIRADAEKLTIKDSNGNVKQYGFGSAIYGWLLEQLIAESGQDYCDKGNGRQGLATKVLFGDKVGVDVATWWAGMVKDGLAVNTGRKTDDAQAAFKSGKVAMNLESTGVLRAYLEAAKGRFEVATAPYPHVADSDTGGPIIGGASLWISGPGHSDAEKRAAWEFVKFLAAPEQQAVWHTGTGYFPINPKALDQPEDKQWVQQYPQFTTAITQLHNTKTSEATAGCLLGVMPQARAASEEGLEKAILGKADPQTAMSQAAQGLQPEISKYNSAVGG